MDYVSLEWLEAHSVTVDILKWILVALIAWVGGAFGYFRTRMRKPELEFLEVASRCRLECQKVRQDQNDVARAAFLVNVGVTNGTREPVFMKSFSLAYRKKGKFRGFHKKIGPCTLPNLPRQKVADGEKFLPVWLTSFPDTNEGLLVEARLESKDYRLGYMLFVSHTFGTWNPVVENEHINIRMYATTTDGVKLRADGKVRVLTDPEILEEMVPGLGELLEQEQSWNVPGI
jgi:hypothetical protein